MYRFPKWERLNSDVWGVIRRGLTPSFIVELLESRKGLYFIYNNNPVSNSREEYNIVSFLYRHIHFDLAKSSTRLDYPGRVFRFIYLLI